jgi:hypothetical protein
MQSFFFYAIPIKERTRGRARKLLPFSWCNQTKREEKRVAKIREKPREKFERLSPRE